MRNIEKRRKYHREYMRGWKQRNAEKVRADVNRRYQKLKVDAMNVVALAQGDSIPRCRIDLTPNTSVSDLPCRGHLQFDHLQGGGNKDRGGRYKRKGQRDFLQSLVMGRRNPNEFRLLCQLHQLWNQVNQ